MINGQKQSSASWRLSSLLVFCCITLLQLLPAMGRDLYLGPAGGEFGMLKTKIKPSDAGVWIDGKYVGHADRFNGPGQEIFLTPGRHEVKVSIAYYKDYTTSVNVQARQTTVIKQNLERSDEKKPQGPFGLVKIRVAPERNVAVIVNGRFIGHADEMNGPGQVLLLEPGAYTIELSYAGYKPYKTSFDIKANERKEVQTRLEPDGAVQYGER